MLQNYEFQEADADPAQPAGWTMDDAIAPDFTYTSGELSFKNTTATGTITPQYIYQDVDISGGTGRLYTVGLNIDAVDTFKMLKFMGLDEDNVNVQVQWLDNDGKVLKTEKTRGFLEHHAQMYSFTGSDYAFESRVYCPRDANITTCRFCVYVAKGVYARKISINQAWMYRDKKPEPYIALGNTYNLGYEPIVKATGNVVNDLRVSFQAYSDWSDVSANGDTPWFCIYPVMAPGKAANKEVSSNDPTWGVDQGVMHGGFTEIPEGLPKDERYCLEMRSIYQGKETVLARDYFYYKPDYQSKKMGWELDSERRFRNRRGDFATMFGVSMDLDRGYDTDDSVFSLNNSAKYLKSLEVAEADLVFAKVSWGNDWYTLGNDVTRNTPNCKWFYDISDHMYEKGMSYYDWFDIANNARVQGSRLMGYVACDNLGMPTLQDAVKYKEQLRSSDRQAVIANRLPGISESEFGEAAVYSRAAGDVVILDLLPSNGSNWRESDFPINNRFFNEKRMFDRPVIALTKGSGANPKDMLRLMAYARDKKLAGLVFDVNPSNAVTDNILNPQLEWSNYVAAMLMKGFLQDDPSRIEGFEARANDGLGTYIAHGGIFTLSNSVATLNGGVNVPAGRVHVNEFVNGEDECFFIVSGTMTDMENNSVNLILESPNSGYVCEIKNIDTAGELTAMQPDIAYQPQVSFNGVTVIYVHKPAN
ncbi:MAG: hypothetical protein IK083_06350 [Abditibacteriota bacterium]|nr:hypothetical protein [Abditibacteriota bacterium]